MYYRAICIAFFAIFPVFAQTVPPDRSKLTLDRVFSQEGLQPERAPAIKWTTAGKYLTSSASGTKKGVFDIVRMDLAGKKEVLIPGEKLVPPGEKEPISIQGYSFSTDEDVVLIYTNSARVWRTNTRGDYWIYRRSTGKMTKVGGNAKPSYLMFAKISPDGTKVGYVYENNLYVQSIDGGVPLQLTKDGNTEIINGTFDWVYEEEFSCRDGWRFSPDSQQIAYWQLDSKGVKTFTLVDQTSANYPTFQHFPYPKAGEQNSACKVGVIPVVGGETKWVQLPGDSRTEYYLPRMEWAGNNDEIMLLHMNRLQNAASVYLANPKTSQLKCISIDRDGAWLDVQDDAMTWLEKGNQLTWISEKDGWRQLYLVSRDGQSVRRVIPGAFDLIRILRIDEANDCIYFYASPDNPTQQYLYRASLSGKTPMTRLSSNDQPGWHDYNISPDATHAVHTYSRFGQPPRSEIITLPNHQTVKTLTTNDRLKENLAALQLPAPELFRVTAGQGVELDGWMLKPANFDPNKKYPMLLYVYGEPAGQSVTDRWGGGQFYWHLMLSQQGYIVACLDNRGTPCPRGRDWRKSIYRKIGVVASEDQANGLKQMLKTRQYIDPNRVGIWGWSGGGSMTLNMLFRYPDLYRTGISVASVPDMRLYDTIYQERYMGLPQENAEDYKNGSPLQHVANLKGNLLLIHGTGDDNCHYQGAERLIDKLVELNKQFTLMAYPNRSHSISEGKGTNRHMFTLMTKYLHEHLPLNPQ